MQSSNLDSCDLDSFSVELDIALDLNCKIGGLFCNNWKINIATVDTCKVVMCMVRIFSPVW